jgi:serine/threonine protein kinase
MRQPSEQDWAAGSCYPIIPRPLALAPGTRLGAYAITAQIGAGGMGEVYRARDTKLNRDVAIKVLPDSFASDADRLARFTREAQTLASLNHPNIAQIYGLEESNGVRALVMEAAIAGSLDWCGRRHRTLTIQPNANREGSLR